MRNIARYTTPVHTFTLPFGTSEITELVVIYKQGDRIVLTKHKDDVSLSDNKIEVSLTESETALFNPTPAVEIQIRVGMGSARMNSDILRVPVSDVLKEGLLDEI